MFVGRDMLNQRQKKVDDEQYTCKTGQDCEYYKFKTKKVDKVGQGGQGCLVMNR